MEAHASGEHDGDKRPRASLCPPHAGTGGGDGSGGPGALGEFLRAQRAEADPDDLGLVADGTFRRVPGLRREELAELAHISVDYLMRIEQGRKVRVSGSVLAALADALRLTADERQYLFAVAEVVPPATRTARDARDEVPAQVLDVVAGLASVPAIVVNRRMDVLAWNDAAATLLGDFAAIPGGHRNLVRLIFLDSRYRALYGTDWESVAEEAVAALRMAAGHHPEDIAIQALVGELGVRDTRFRTWWARHAVSGPKLRRKTFHHPLAGPLVLDAQIYAVDGRSDLSLVAYTAQSGSSSHERLRRLIEEHRHDHTSEN